MSAAMFGIPACLTFGMDIVIAMRRVDKFLRSEELDLEFIKERKTDKDGNDDGDNDYIIKFDNVDFFWRKPVPPINPKASKEKKSKGKNNDKKSKKTSNKSLLKEPLINIDGDQEKLIRNTIGQCSEKHNDKQNSSSLDDGSEDKGKM